MNLKSYRVYVEIGEYYGGYDSTMGGQGAWTSNTSQQFETVVQAQYPDMAVRIAQAQFGGPANCRVTFRGEVK